MRDLHLIEPQPEDKLRWPGHRVLRVRDVALDVAVLLVVLQVRRFVPFLRLYGFSYFVAAGFSAIITARILDHARVSTVASQLYLTMLTSRELFHAFLRPLALRIAVAWTAAMILGIFISLALVWTQSHVSSVPVLVRQMLLNSIVYSIVPGIIVGISACLLSLKLMISVRQLLLLPLVSAILSASIAGIIASLLSLSLQQLPWFMSRTLFASFQSGTLFPFILAPLCYWLLLNTRNRFYHLLRD